MDNDQINFRVLLRSPKYPVIVIAYDDIWAAFGIQELGRICLVSEPVGNEDKIKVIDRTGEEFWYLCDQYALTPGFLTKKWTKKQIIDLYNDSESSKESNIQYSYKSLSAKRLSRIVAEICDILNQNLSI